MTWADTQGHTTWVPDGKYGAFALCEPCWAELTPEQRVPYYEQLADDWLTDSTSLGEDEDIEQRRAELRAAVLAGG